MDKQEFFKSIIGEQIEFTIPRFRITNEQARTGVITGVDNAFVYIDTEPYCIGLVEVE